MNPSWGFPKSPKNIYGVKKKKRPLTADFGLNLTKLELFKLYFYKLGYDDKFKALAFVKREVNRMTQKLWNSR